LLKNISEPIEITDANAVSLASQGDADAFSHLYEQNIGRIYNYVFFRIGSEADAEDITARVFHRAFNHIGRYVEKGVPFSAWLYRIAHNLIANWHRDNHRKKEVSLEDQLDFPHQGDLPEKTLEQRQETERLLKAIRRLSPDRQQLILLKYLEDLPNAEIAIIMSRTEGAIKSLYHRALIALREELSETPAPSDTKGKGEGSE
jgi:RNA polymerase sigma-70 factor, ECF subfamily